MMEEVEKLCDRLELASLLYLNETFTSPTKEVGIAALTKQKELMSKLEKRKRKLRLVCAKYLRLQRHQLLKVEMAVKIGQKRIDLQLLIKTVSLFLAGTDSRWEVIAKYMNTHSTSGSQKNCQRFYWQRTVSQNLALIKKMTYCVE